MENYRLLQERQHEIGGALSCQRMLAFLLFNCDLVGYISPIRPEAARGRMCTKFGTAVANIITCGKFFGDRLRGVHSVGGRKLPFPIDKASRR